MYKPSLLQTRGYAHAVLEASIGALGAGGDVSAALDARLARQQRWRASATRVHFLIAEQALYTVVGDPETTRVQLETLLGWLPGTAVVGIVPRTARFRASATVFVVYDDTRVAVETATGTLRFCDPAASGDYPTVFDLLTQDAVLGSEADSLIHESRHRPRVAATFAFSTASTLASTTLPVSALAGEVFRYIRFRGFHFMAASFPTAHPPPHRP
ncbi:Scr1 family TA system antitoxin-like transcriptional regulator, partial [Nocardia noduli]|uniref:Scr1 family TA system antitoxin-like transcriptional regulator n=1 Tax=Nocardia noduli TaxID=2815722 RepID=UPI001C218AD0